MHWQPILKTIGPKLIRMQFLSDHLRPIVPSQTPRRSRLLLLARCAAWVSTARSQERLMFCVIPWLLPCSGKECPSRRSLLCSAIVPF